MLIFSCLIFDSLEHAVFPRSITFPTLAPSCLGHAKVDGNYDFFFTYVAKFERFLHQMASNVHFVKTSTD